MNDDFNMKKLSSGIPGLDEVLNEGLIAGDTYLIRGGPGTGKTTVGLHYLCEGSKNGESSLFICLSESVDNIKRNAHQKGFDIQGIHFFDFTPSSEIKADELEYNIFSSNEVEQPSLIKKIAEAIDEVNPDRLFLDGITQLSYLAVDNYQFRKQILSLVKFASKQGGTVMLSSEASEVIKDDDLQFMCDGVINLESTGEEYKLIVSKFRGSDFKKGYHTITLSSKGILVYPSISMQEVKHDFSPEILSSGVPEIDKLLHGGIERGTTTVLSGPTGVGKSTLAIQFAKEASGRGERSVIYTFEEGVESLKHRAKSVNIPIDKMIEQDNASVEKINPLDYTPDQFAHHIRREVEQMNTKIVILDSVSGYLLSFIRDTNHINEMLRHLHNLSEYLKSKGVTLIFANEVHEITGQFKVSEYGISYLADNIIFLRYLEYEGELRKAVGVLKKRLSNFEKTLREFEITSYGIRVGRPLRELRGILSGSPELVPTKNSYDE